MGHACVTSEEHSHAGTNSNSKDPRLLHFPVGELNLSRTAKDRVFSHGQKAAKSSSSGSSEQKGHLDRPQEQGGCGGFHGDTARENT